MALLILGFVIVISYIIFKLGFSRPPNFPPGLPIVPILGSIPFIKKSHESKFGTITSREYKEKYGKIYSLYLGCIPTVMIQDLALAKEILNREEFQGRVKGIFTKEIRAYNGKPHGIIFEEGITWQIQRRFALKVLKDFGFGRVSIDENIAIEANEVVHELLKSYGGVLKVDGNFNIPVMNVLWVILAGKRFAYNDPEMKTFSSKLTSNFRNNPTQLFTFFPLLTRMFPKMMGYYDQQRLFSEWFTFWKEIIDEHKVTLDDNEPSDFIDVYLKTMKTDNNLTEEHLTMIIQDMFAAGMETTSTTLMWCLQWLALYPEIQSRCQAEIDEHIGRETSVTMDDQQRLVLTTATILEIQRISSIAPGIVPHFTTAATKILNFDIPKDTMILVNIINIMNDPEYWTNPEEFDPERFIIDGKIVKPDAFIPFGYGKRACMGESLAKRELFIFFTTFLQKLTFSVSESHPNPNPADCTAEITRIPNPFFVQVTKR